MVYFPPPPRKYELLLIYYLHFKIQTAYPLPPEIKGTVVRAFWTTHLGVWFSLFRVTSDGYETDKYASIIANSVFVEVEKIKKIAKKVHPGQESCYCLVFGKQLFIIYPYSSQMVICQKHAHKRSGKLYHFTISWETLRYDYSG